MRRRIVAPIVFALAAVTATAASAAPQLIYKVDHVTAKIVNRHLVVTASGAVTTGGWTQPRLHLKEFRTPESDTEVFEFLATPPLSNDVVIQALLPISATAVFPLPPYAVVNVTVAGQTNRVTAPIQTH